MSAVSVVTGTTFGGVVLACSMMAMPTLIVNVSLSDIAAATTQGFSNPIRAAALINLDNLASAVLGASTWHTNNFMGPVTYRSLTIFGMTGTTIVTEDKPCNSDAIDKETTDEETTQSGGGGGGFTPGLRPVSTVDGEINTGTVTVGDIISAP